MKNIHIAQGQRRYNKIVGHIVAEAALLVLILNAIVVPVGLILLALTFFTGNWLGATLASIVAFVIGAIGAVVIDSQILSACAGLRTNRETIATIKQQYAIIPKEQRHKDIKDQEGQELAVHEREQYLNGVAIGVYSCLSAGIGSFTWDKLFIVALPPSLAIPFGIVLSFGFSGAFILCELRKRTNNEIIRQSIVSDHFMREAAHEDATELALQKLGEQMEQKAKEIAATETTRYTVEEIMTQTYDSLLGGQGLIPQRIHREKIDKQLAIAQDRDEARQQLLLIKGGNATVGGTQPLSIPATATRVFTNEERVRQARLDNPNASQRELARITGLSVSTINRYSSKKLDVSSNT